jgi:hypothetical protein
MPQQDSGIATEAPVARPRRPTFLFAKRHGVLVTGEEEGKAVVLHTPGIEPSAVVELRRFMGKPLKLQQVDKELRAGFQRSHAHDG